MDLTSSPACNLQATATEASPQSAMETTDHSSSDSRTRRFSENTSTPPAYSDGHDDDSDSDIGPPPPYAPAAPALSWRNITRAAMLSVAPPPGAPRHLHQLRSRTLLLPGSSTQGAGAALLRRLPAPLARVCRSVRTRWKAQKHASCAAAAPRAPPSAVGAGEVEHPVPKGQQDWTLDWDYVLNVRNNSRGSHTVRGHSWFSRARFYFRDMPPRGLGEMVPWGDPERTERVPEDAPYARFDGEPFAWVAFTWKFCERSERPRWAATFTVYFQEGGPLDGDTSELGVVTALDDPWIFFHPAYTVAAEMDHRTGPARFKKVMWYFQLLGYGNDVLGHPMRAWEKGQWEQCSEFMKPFLPVSMTKMSSRAAVSLGFWV